MFVPGIWIVRTFPTTCSLDGQEGLRASVPEWLSGPEHLLGGNPALPIQACRIAPVDLSCWRRHGPAGMRQQLKQQSGSPALD